MSLTQNDVDHEQRLLKLLGKQQGIGFSLRMNRFPY